MDHYEIWRGTTAGGVHDFVTSVPVGTTEYIDKDLNPGTTYYYVVTAWDKSGNEGPLSNEASAKPSP